MVFAQVPRCLGADTNTNTLMVRQTPASADTLPADRYDFGTIRCRQWPNERAGTGPRPVALVWAAGGRLLDPSYSDA